MIEGIHYKRLIEVDLPIRRISAHARREKSIRQGHISTLHIWWARRPLAACRAIACAALWPDPADPACPHAFRETAAAVIREFATRHLDLLSEDSYRRYNAIARNPSALSDALVLRQALLDFIADFADWDNATQERFIESSARLTAAAIGHEAEDRPMVLDPFAGGGAIPLEAVRVGANAFASDLNPLPILLNRIVLEMLPRFGLRLVDETRKWGDWVRSEVETELNAFYPPASANEQPIAYIWSRVVRCEGPGCGAEVPLIKSLWLGKKPHNAWALKVTPSKQAKSVVVDVVRGVKAADVGLGTSRRGAAVCPCCSYTTPATSVRTQLSKLHGGASHSRLLCVVTKVAGEKGRIYRLPTAVDLDAVDRAKERLQEVLESSGDLPFSVLPEEPLPPQGTLGFRVQLYGIKRWRDLFHPRQLLMLSRLSEKVREVRDHIARAGGDVDLADAVQTLLALNVDKMADYSSSLASWSSPASQETVRGTFSRQALAMVWDFAEAYPFASSSGGWSHNLEFLLSPLAAESAVTRVGTGHAERASATEHPLPDDSVDAVITDPPYYDAIPYADLSDFFIVWLKRSLYSSSLSREFASLSNKDQECVVDTAKGHDKKYFENTMRRAMEEARRVVKPTGIGVVVFAHKTTGGWEAQLQAMIDAGWVITASWPIDTEREGRVRANSSAALASSVHLVCRPRENSAGAVRSDDVGDWRAVLSELPVRTREWMPRLAAEGVVGADAIFACLGPALEVFSKFSRVEKANGETVTLTEYLEHVWATVAKQALSMVLDSADTTGLEPDGRLTAIWLWTLGGGSAAEEFDPSEDDTEEEDAVTKKPSTSGFTLEFDAARKLAQGLGAHLEEMNNVVEVRGETARLLPVTERARYLFAKGEEEAKSSSRKKKNQQSSLFAEIEALEEIESGALVGAAKPANTTLDRIHQSMILFGAGRAEALKRFLIEEGVGNQPQFWKLAQSLSALYPGGTDEKRWIDGVLARKKSFGFA